MRLLLAAVATLCGCFAQEPTIVLPQGPVRGIKVFTESRRAINAYLGIPYAAPPIGELRFAPPERHPGWNRTLFAGRFAAACPQPLDVGVVAQPQDEDCLTLNVWTPESALGYRSLPVVVFLEGEGFVSGSPSRFPAQDLAAEDIVVVSVSYRLNVFGFFCLEDSTARGNLGLLDQYMALRWVQANIAHFYGDAGSVTLMGHSAGAAAALFHSVSPRTEGLFRNLILMSGSGISTWHMTRRSGNASRELAHKVGCTGDESDALVACLRSKSVSELLRAFEVIYQNGNWTELMLPTVDDFLPAGERYLPKSPTEALENGEYLSMPVLTGTTSAEGAFNVYQWGDLSRQGASAIQHFLNNTAVPCIMQRLGWGSSKAVKEVVLWKYANSTPATDSKVVLQRLVDLYSDSQWLAPHAAQTRLLSRYQHQVFVYRWEQVGPDLYGSAYNSSGAVHGSEFLYLFGPSLMLTVVGRRFTLIEDRFSKQMKRMWADFIRLGTPFAGQYHPDSQDMTLGQTPRPSKSSAEIYAEADALWNNLLPRLAVTSAAPPNGGNSNQDLTSQPHQVTEGGDINRSFRNATFTLLSVVVLLLVLLAACLVLLKRRAKERDKDLF